MRKTGILITHTGTPEAPTISAVRRYLRAFLSDKRIVQLPRLLWLPILYGLILPLRPRRSAKLYSKIWTQQGSPMRVFMHKLAEKLMPLLNKNPSKAAIAVEIGMHYGQPSIPESLEKLRQADIDQLIVLPLFPQYSNTTTAASFDQVNRTLASWPALPTIRMIRDYATHPHYIDALATHVRQSWATQGQSDHLLISFHGIPKRFVDAGDPYGAQCEQTAALLADALQLKRDQWTCCYQSQFGYDKWLQPSTQVLLQTLPKQGIRELDIICPGFSVDCLETLEEIAITGKESFLKAGGKTLRYIPALNDSDEQTALLTVLLKA